jgi:hypothetical protein
VERPILLNATTAHKELCHRAVKWLKSTGGCFIAATEITTHATYEIPDAIGWASRSSILIEVKVSRADFLRDKKKYHRRIVSAGMGDFRYFMAPLGLLSVDEVPDGWGLLEVKDNRVLKSKAATSLPKNERAEIGFIASLMRRNEDLMKKVYDVERCRSEHMINGKPPAGMPALECIRDMGLGSKECLDNFAEKFAFLLVTS